MWRPRSRTSWASLRSQWAQWTCSRSSSTPSPALRSFGCGLRTGHKRKSQTDRSILHTRSTCRKARVRVHEQLRHEVSPSGAYWAHLRWRSSTGTRTGWSRSSPCTAVSSPPRSQDLPSYVRVGAATLRAKSHIGVPGHSNVGVMFGRVTRAHAGGAREGDDTSTAMPSSLITTCSCMSSC